MPLTGVYGKGGSGKNTIVAYFKAKYLPNIETFTNFPLKTQNTKQIDSFELFELPETDNPRLVIYDEAYTEGLDNRDFMTLQNRLQSYLLFQARKNNISFIAISQLQILDIRWRGLEEIIIYCKDRPIYNKDLTDYKGDFHYVFYNGKKAIPYTLKYKDAKKLFCLFDTKRKILPKDFEILKAKFDLRNPKKRNEYVNKIVKKILNSVKDLTIKDITHLFVKNIMLDLELPNLTLEPYVYLRLKNKLQQQAK